MAFSPVTVIRLAPAIADVVEALEDVFDGEGNLRADILDAIGELYDLAAKVSPKVAAIPRSSFILIVRGAFDISSGTRQIIEATK